MRYNPDGTLDTSFGTGGRVTTDIEGGDNEIPYAVAVQTDGKIVVVGQFQNGTGFDYDFGVVRYNSDGSLDASFGTGGKVSTSIGDSEDKAHSVIIQPDGKILVGGSALSFGGGASGRFAVVRYNPDGSLDNTFDNDGKVIIQQNGFGGMTQQPDGKIILASSEGFTPTSNFVVSRLHPNGSLDNSFGSGGTVTTNFNSGPSSASSVVVQPDNKIIVAGTGYTGIGPNTHFALARYNENGSLDTSFDGDGKVTTSFGNNEEFINALALQPDGKIIAVGHAYTSSGSNQMAFARYNSDGSLDSGFGRGGKHTIRLFHGREYAYDVALQVDGKIVIGGTAGGFTTSKFVAIRLNPNGEHDQSFNSGTPGRIITAHGEIDGANAVVIQPDGKILTAGATSSFSLLDFSLSRFNRDGTPDLTFGIGGKVVTSVYSSQDGATAVAVRNDGKIVAVGYSGIPGITDITIVRYNPNGSLDTTFDNDGIVIMSRSGATESATGVVIQPDGKIVVGGYSDASSSFMYFLLARFNENGSLDTSFGSGGIVTTDIGSGGDFAKALLMQSDGKLIAVGTSRTGNEGDFAAVRYNPNGTLDTSFGIGGKVVTPIGDANDDATAAAIQSDGKLIVAGIAAYNSGSNFAVARYKSDGTLDTSFGENGKVITSFGNSYLEAVAVQPSGKIIAVGEKIQGDFYDVAVVRLHTNGLLDSSFGTGGVSITDISQRDIARGIALQDEYKIVVAGSAYGSSQNPPQANLFVLRYLAHNQTIFDYDGDARSDISVFRPSTGSWYLLQTSNGSFFGQIFGLGTDIIAPADYDGDGKTDYAVFRPDSGSWYLQQSASSFTGVQFGQNGDIPVPADYDGDGKADIAVYRPSTGGWYRLNSSNGQFVAVAFGTAEDKPTIGDFDGDGKADIAVFRPSTTNWFRLNSSNNQFVAVPFGAADDKLTPVDFDGDGKTDIAVYRPSTGGWYRLNSTNGEFVAVGFGTAEDKPVPADYDGDGKADIAVFRPSDGNWYLLRSTAGFAAVQFGQANDKPVPNAFVR